MEKIQFSERDRGSKVKFATCILVYLQLHYIFPSYGMLLLLIIISKLLEPNESLKKKKKHLVP